MTTISIAVYVGLALVGLALWWLWPQVNRSRATFVGVMALLLGAALLHQALYATNAEDAYITYRYAANWANGLGPVFNSAERVEGYSNFLLVAILAVGRRLGIDIVWAARLGGVVFSLLTLHAVYCLSNRIGGNCRRSGLLSMLLVLSSAPLAAYGPSGMETPLFTWLTVAAVGSVVARRWWLAGILAGLATMTRPDGVVIFGGLAIWSMLQLLGGRTRVGWIGLMAGYGLLMLPWTAWRWAYYGYLIPNCLQAKRGMDFVFQITSGGSYLLQFAGFHLPWLLLLLYLLARRRTSQVEPKHASLLGIVITCYVGFVVFIGGDWMPAYRMLAPVVPFLCILISTLAVTMKGAGGVSPRRELLPFLLVMLAGIAVAFPLVEKIRDWNTQVADGTRLGRWWRRSLPPDTWMASYANGALSYYSQLPTIDMLGLTDEHIARRGQRLRRGMPGHIAFDNAYVASRKPVVLYFSGVPFQKQPDSRVPPLFAHAYQATTFRFRDSGSPYGEYVNLIVRRSRRDDVIRLLQDTDNGITFVESK